MVFGGCVGFEGAEDIDLERGWTIDLVPTDRELLMDDEKARDEPEVEAEGPDGANSNGSSLPMASTRRTVGVSGLANLT